MMKIDRRGGNPTARNMAGWQAILLSCTALAAISATSAVAQDGSEAAGGTQLETIVIEGSGNGDDDARTIVARKATGVGKMPTEVLQTPASVSVITSKEVQERGASTVEQVVQYTAGVVTDFYGSDDRFDYFDIRGFTPYTYRDGLPIGRTFGAAREEPYAFERIEILKGASSAGFGAAEPGGSVNYVTKLPKSERFGEVYGTVGSFSHKEAGIDFGDNITEDDTLSYRLTGIYQNADAEYDHSQDDKKFIMGGLTWRPTDLTSLSFVFDHLNTDGVPGSGGHPIGSDFDRDRFFGEPDYYFRTTNRNTYSVMLDHDFGNGLTFGSNARYMKSADAFGGAYLSNTRTDGSNLADRYYFGSDKSSEQFRHRREPDVRNPLQRCRKPHPRRRRLQQLQFPECRPVYPRGTEHQLDESGLLRRAGLDSAQFRHAQRPDDQGHLRPAGPDVSSTGSPRASACGTTGSTCVKTTCSPASSRRAITASSPSASA
jgi:iron complex outermembrane receptor protein